MSKEHRCIDQFVQWCPLLDDMEAAPHFIYLTFTITLSTFVFQCNRNCN